MFSVQLAIFSGHLAVSVWLAMFSVQHATFSVQHAMFSAQLAAFSVQLATLSVQHATFSVQQAVFSVQLAMFSVQLATFSVQLACMLWSPYKIRMACHQWFYWMNVHVFFLSYRRACRWCGWYHRRVSTRSCGTQPCVPTVQQALKCGDCWSKPPRGRCCQTSVLRLSTSWKVTPNSSTTSASVLRRYPMFFAALFTQGRKECDLELVCSLLLFSLMEGTNVALN